MRTGKLNVDELKINVIDLLGKRRSEVLLSAGVSKDCAAVRCDDIILLTSDPITGATKNAGTLAVNISANDIAAGGGEPFCCLITVLAPSGASVSEIREVMSEAEEQAKLLNIAIVGGHTEFTAHVDRIIISCTMLGRAKELIGKPIKPGDSIILTKFAGIEGTFILAGERAEEFELDSLERQEADGLQKLMSVIKEGRIAVKHGYSAMHDVTEGGVLGAIYEMTLQDGLGADIIEDKIPVLPLTKKICGKLDIDPLKLIASGSMLIIAEKPDEMIAAMINEGVNASKIGEINNTSRVRVLRKDGKIEIISSQDDEIYKL